VGESVVFSFPRPVSIEVLLVSNAAEDVLWEFIADEFQPSPFIGGDSGGSFQSWPIDKAPPQLLAMLAQVESRLDRELEERGPRKPPIAEITYGQLPPGYLEKHPPSELKPGEYSVLVFSEQGQGGSRFTIAA
jgi:hypothetical protein